MLLLDRGTAMGAGRWALNFSALQANELVFSSDLSFGLKQRIAGEMVKQTRVMSKDALLECAAQQLAGGSLADRALYFAVYPLGKLHLFIVRLQDHWEILSYIWGQKGLQPAVQRKPASLDWAALAGKAAAQVAKESNNNVFDVNNSWWDANGADVLKQESAKNDDSSFIRGTMAAEPWRGLEQALAVLHELGADTLVVGIPMYGPYMDFTGVSRQARATSTMTD